MHDSSFFMVVPYKATKDPEPFGEPGFFPVPWLPRYLGTYFTRHPATFCLDKTCCTTSNELCRMSRLELPTYEQRGDACTQRTRDDKCVIVFCTTHPTQYSKAAKCM